MWNKFKAVLNIAQNKNSGSPIHKGLIPAVKFTAKEISTSGDIEIEVHNINVDQRISEDIEIPFFKIITKLLESISKQSKIDEIIICFVEKENHLHVFFESKTQGKQDENELLPKSELTKLKNQVESINGNITFEPATENEITLDLNISL